MTATARLLIVDDEAVALRNLEHVMTHEGYQVTATTQSVEALTLIEQDRFDVILTDLRMDQVDGMQILVRAREASPDTEVIMITGHASLEGAVEAMKHGSFHYIAKPFRLDEVRRVVAEAAEKNRLKRENRALRAQVDSYEGRTRIITQNATLQKLLETARQIAPTGCNVLIIGESGTGKEVLARFLHERSTRPGPFVGINCGAFNEELLANELFGHERGAFTGATAGKPGLIETAAGGTLFLDEVTEMSLAMQVKLLRMIQEREFYRLGGTTPIPVDARFIAASNRDILAGVRAGTFRQDLYFRLNVVNLPLPTLAERREDIPRMAVHFMERHAAAMQRPVREITPEAIDILARYDYPGNVRELENLIERAVAMAPGTTIGVEQLPEDLRRLKLRTYRRPGGTMPTLEDHVREYIEWVLSETGGNQTAAAQVLGIDRVSLWRKLKRYQQRGG